MIRHGKRIYHESNSTHKKHNFGQFIFKQTYWYSMGSQELVKMFGFSIAYLHSTEAIYYTQNAHGDVVNLTDADGAVKKLNIKTRENALISPFSHQILQSGAILGLPS